MKVFVFFFAKCAAIFLDSFEKATEPDESAQCDSMLSSGADKKSSSETRTTTPRPLSESGVTLSSQRKLVPDGCFFSFFLVVCFIFTFFLKV